MVATSTSLNNVVQWENESLQQYMAQFAKTSIHILNLHPTVAMHMLLMGFCIGKFFNTLYVNPPVNMDELHT